VDATKPKFCTYAHARDLQNLMYSVLPSAAALRALGTKMDKPKYTARIENIYFLARIGETLRWATQDIADEELPTNIKYLLAKLDRLEARAEAKRHRSADEPSTRMKAPTHD
jgi:hypothetical protein